MELDAHLRLAVGERLARLEDERHAVPPRRVDAQDGRREGLGVRVLVGDRRVLEVARVLARARVLPDDEVVELDGLARLQHLELLLHDVLRGEGERLLHRHECHDLQQVVLHDVADDAVLVEVAAAPLRPEVLLEDHLHRLDRLPVPDRREGDVGEAQHEEVHDELLAEVVVDAVDLVLAEHRELAHELRAALRVAPERLLQHEALHRPEPRAVAEWVRRGDRAERAADGRVEKGRHGHVVHAHLVLLVLGGALRRLLEAPVLAHRDPPHRDPRPRHPRERHRERLAAHARRAAGGRAEREALRRGQARWPASVGGERWPVRVGERWNERVSASFARSFTRCSSNSSIFSWSAAIDLWSSNSPLT